MQFETRRRPRRATPICRTTRVARALARAAALALCLAGAAACGDGATNPQVQDIAGTYTLREVAGDTLPATIFDGPWTFDDGTVVSRFTVVVTGGAYVLLRDGDVLELFDVRLEYDGVSDTLQLYARKTYSLRGDSITIENRACGCRESGTVKGGTLRVMADAVGSGTPLEYVYRSDR